MSPYSLDLLQNIVKEKKNDHKLHVVESRYLLGKYYQEKDQLAYQSQS